MKNSILIAKHFSGNLSADEKQEFAAWLRKDLRNEQIVAAYGKIWTAAGAANNTIETDTAVEWEKFKANLAARPVTLPRLPFYQLYWRQAAAAAAVLLVGIGTIYLWPEKEAGAVISHAAGSSAFPQFTAISTSTEINDFYLPDSTHVFLNANSRLSYLASFSGPTRATWLTGEGYFEVTKSDRPFIVYADETQVSVLGTAFSIKVNEADETVELVVTEGLVSFRSEDAPAASEIILEPNEMLTFNKKENKVNQSAAGNTIPWWGKHKWGERFDWTEKRNELLNKIKLKKQPH